MSVPLQISAPFPIFSLVGFLFVGIGLLAVGYAVRSSWTAVRLLRIGDSTVLSLSEGFPRRVSLFGEAKSTGEHDPLTGPFSGRECLAVAFEVEELRTRSDGKNTTRSWVTIDSGAAGVPFVLDDRTAGILVDPAAATFSLGADETVRVAGGRPPPERIRSFIEADPDVDSEERVFELGPLKLRTGNDRRYVERRLEPGDQVCVIGAPSAARGDVGEMNATIAGGDPFVVSDAPRRQTAYRMLGTAFVPFLVGAVFVVVGAVFALALGVGF